MKLTITIQMDNAAFADDGNDGRTEAARLLEIIALKLNQGIETRGVLIETNGNNCGKWAITGKAGAR